MNNYFTDGELFWYENRFNYDMRYMLLACISIVKPNHKGCYLSNYVCEQMSVKDKDYFGLRFVDSTGQRVSALFNSLFIDKIFAKQLN